MRVIALDVHRSFAQVAELEDGVLRQRGRVDLVRHKVLEFARTLRPDDEVVLEATGNTMAIVRLLKPRVGRVVIANPLQVRVIAEAKAKTDRIDAAVLARLHAAGYLPEVWQPDEATERLRRLVARRAAVVQGMPRTKNRVRAVLHANLIPRHSGKLFMAPGRRWRAEQPLAEDDRAAVDRWLAALDAMEKELTVAEADLASACLGDDRIRRLMTIGGVNLPVAAGVLSAIGDVTRFASAEKLVSYLGLDPRVRQSGDKPAQHGRISKQGRAHAHGMLVEAAWAAAVTPGPLRAFHLRIQGRKGKQGRRGRDRAQDRGAGLAPAHQAGGLRLGAPCPGRHEAATDAAQGRGCFTPRRQRARAGSELQHQGAARTGAGLGRAGGESLHAVRRGLVREAGSEAEASAQGQQGADSDVDQPEERDCAGNSALVQRIRGVDDPAHLGGKSIERDHLRPVPPPGLGDGRVFAAPGALLKGIERGPARLGVAGTVDRLQRRGDRLAVLVADEVE